MLHTLRVKFMALLLLMPASGLAEVVRDLYSR